MIIKTCNAKKQRRQERKKKSIGLISKNNNFARDVHFFVHFFAVVVATWNFLVARFMKKMSYIKSHDTSHYGSCVHVCGHEKKVACVPNVAFFFLLPLIFTLLAGNICHFPTAKIFMLFFQPNYFALDFCSTFSC